LQLHPVAPDGAGSYIHTAGYFTHTKTFHIEVNNGSLSTVKAHCTDNAVNFFIFGFLVVIIKRLGRLRLVCPLDTKFVAGSPQKGIFIK
jgi:hypothetical protein